MPAAANRGNEQSGPSSARWDETKSQKAAETVSNSWLRSRPYLLWGYLIEIACALVLYGLIWGITGYADISKFIQITAGHWAQLMGVLFAAALAIWAAFVAITATEFGEYLDQQHRLRAYSTTFLVACAIFFITTALLITAVGVSRSWVHHVAFVALLYSIANAFTVVTNSSKLIFLYATFQRTLRIEMDRLSREDAIRAVGADPSARSANLTE